AVRTRWDGLARLVALVCDEAPPAERLAGVVAERFGVSAEPAAFAAALRALVARGLVAPLDGRLVFLGLRGEIPRLPSLEEFPGGHPTAGPRSCDVSVLPLVPRDALRAPG